MEILDSEAIEIEMQEGEKPSSDPAPGIGLRVVLAIALVIGAVGAAAPALLFTWLLLALLAAGVIAEALEQSGGLVPTTFGGGYYLSVAIDVVVVLWSLIRLMRAHPSPWQPLSSLFLLYVVSLWTLLPLDLLGYADVPDVLTTSTLLGTGWLVLYALPCILLFLLVRGTRHVWRVGQTSIKAAERTGMLALSLGATGLSVAGALVAVGAEGYFDQLAPSGNELEAIEIQGIEGDRQTFAELSADIGPPPLHISASGPIADRQPPFHQCAETLSIQHQDSRSVLEKAMTNLIRKGLSRTDAEDLTMDILLQVCLRHAQTPLRELIPYFWRSVANGYKLLQQRQGRWQEWNDSASWPDGYAGIPLSPYQEAALAQDIEVLDRVWSTLPAPERHVLELRYRDERGYEDIAERLGEKNATVRKRAQRGMSRLQDAFWAEVGRFEHP